MVWNGLFHEVYSGERSGSVFEWEDYIVLYPGGGRWWMGLDCGWLWDVGMEHTRGSVGRYGVKTGWSENLDERRESLCDMGYGVWGLGIGVWGHGNPSIDVVQGNVGESLWRDCKTCRAMDMTISHPHKPHKLRDLSSLSDLISTRQLRFAHSTGRRIRYRIIHQAHPYCRTRHYVVCSTAVA